MSESFQYLKKPNQKQIYKALYIDSVIRCQWPGCEKPRCGGNLIYKYLWQFYT